MQLRYLKRDENTLAERFQRFLEKANQKHGDLYDYTFSEQDYRSTRSPICIGCKQCCSVFQTLPQDHVAKNPHRKGGCPACVKPAMSLKKALDIRWSNNHSERINQYRIIAELKHSNSYNYPYLESEYDNEKSVITIECKQCNHEFKTQARIHTSKQRYGGCTVCNEEKKNLTISEKTKMKQLDNYQSKDMPVPVGHIYQITNTLSGKTYIGYTTMGLKERFKAHRDAAKQIGKNGFKSKSYLHHAIRKYGADVFKIDALQTFNDITPIQLANREAELIEILNPKYNLTKGGDMWGPTCTKAKPVQVLDLQRNVIGSYRSMAHAAKSVEKATPLGVGKACSKKIMYVNLYWEYANID
jgi:hypothetical protein